MDSITKGMVAPDRKILNPRSLLLPIKFRCLRAMRASRTFSADTSIPSTAAARDRTVRINEKSIARVGGRASFVVDPRQRACGDCSGADAKPGWAHQADAGVYI